MENLNETDNKILGFTRKHRRSINEIARFLNLSPASVSVRVKELLKKGLVDVTKSGHGKKTFVRNKKEDKTQEHYVSILKEIKKRGGEVTDEEFAKILPFDPFDIEEQDRFNATLSLPFVRPKLVQKKIVITKEGLKFLKDHDKAKSQEGKKYESKQ
jgi:DNA-binding Lrp family transcriptional regulator